MVRHGRFQDRAIEWCWLILCAGLPLFFAPWGRNAFELPKAALLWSTAGFMAAMWLLSPRAEKDSSSGRARMTLASVCAGAVLLSTAFADSPLQQAQGSLERMMGGVTLLCCLAVFVVVGQRLGAAAQYDRLLAAIAFGSVPVVAFGLLQSLGSAPLPDQWEGAPVIATLGRSNFVGAYLVIALPLTWAGAVRARRGALRFAFWALMALQLACLAATACRAAWLGAFAAGVLLAASWLWRRGRRPAAISVVCACVVAVLASAGSVFSAEEGSLQARGLIWRSATELISARPWFGYGPDAFAQAFTSVYPPALVYAQGRGVLVDRAHNAVLDGLAALGVVGVTAFAALVLTVAISAARSWARTQDARERALIAAALAAIVGHIVETQFSFAVVVTAVLFWLVLGVLVSLTDRAEELERIGAPSPARLMLSGGLMVLAAGASAVVLAADWSAGPAPVGERVARLQRAVALWPTQPAYLVDLSWEHLQRARQSGSDMDFRAAESTLARAAAMLPSDYRTWAALAEAYSTWGSAGAPGRFAAANGAFSRAASLFPSSAMVQTGWGASLMAEGRVDLAADHFERAVVLDQTDVWAYAHLGDARLAGGDIAGARRAYAEALRLGRTLGVAQIGSGQIAGLFAAAGPESECVIPNDDLPPAGEDRLVPMVVPGCSDPCAGILHCASR